MPAPATADDLLQLVRKSGLVAPQRLDEYAAGLRAGGRAPSDPAALAREMVRGGLLTYFQSRQLLAGKYRGFLLGRYKILEHLGAGGMGTVLLCEHTHMRHRVAVKVLPPDKARDPSALTRFYREARAAASLDHPNLVRAHDIDRQDRHHFLVMDYVDGVSLQAVVRKHGPLDPVRAAHYVRQAALGLQHAHESGLVHRDVKPGNLLLDRQGTVKVTDLGLTRVRDDGGEALTHKYDGQFVLGSADYFAPEQAVDSHAVDIRADVYSLGATFYYLLTGRPPFAEGTVAQKLLCHQMREPRPLREVRPDVPEGLAAVLARMMAKAPSDRYQTPADVAEALAPWARTPVPPPDPSDFRRLSLAARGPKTPADRAAPPQAASRESTTGTPKPSADEGRPPEERGPDTSPVPTPVTAAPRAGRWRAAAASAVAAVRAKARRRGWQAAAVLAGLVLVNVGLWWAFTRPGRSDAGAPPPGAESPPAAPPSRSSVRLVRDGTREEEVYRTLREAVDAARPGDRVVVQAEAVHGPLALKGDGARARDLTIEGEAPSGGRVVWLPGSRYREGEPLLRLSDVSGVRVRGFAFDGRGQAEDLIAVSGSCPGLELDGLRLQGFRRSAVRLEQASGAAGRPLTLSRLRAATNTGAEAAVAFAEGNGPENRHVLVRDCRFEGSFRAAVLLAWPARDLELRHNRFYRARAGLLCEKTGAARSRLAVRANTFYEVQTALHFPAEAAVADVRAAVEDNLFVRVGRLAQVEDFNPSLPTSAEWVWFDEGAPGLNVPPEPRYFRKAFEVRGPAAPRATLNLVCDDAFVVWVNAVRVGEGEFFNWHRRVHAFDVTEHLRPGRNVLAVRGTNYPEGPTGQNPAGLLVHLGYAGGGARVTVVTDATWKAAREEADGWQRPDFDDDAWPPARVQATNDRGVSVWDNLVWDAAVRERFGGGDFPVVSGPRGNVRDRPSREGFPPLLCRSFAMITLPDNPNNDREFLRYSKNSLLNRSGTGGGPVGVPPAE